MGQYEIGQRSQSTPHTNDFSTGTRNVAIDVQPIYIYPEFATFLFWFTLLAFKR